MVSRHNDTKKPGPDHAPVQKVRKCLMCGNKFKSKHIGERICSSCKETSVWRSGGVAA